MNLTGKPSIRFSQPSEPATHLQRNNFQSQIKTVHHLNPHQQIYKNNYQSQIRGSQPIHLHPPTSTQYSFPKISSEITFGKQPESGIKQQPVRITFQDTESNRNNYVIQNSYPVPSYVDPSKTFRSQQPQNGLKLKQVKTSQTLKSGQVKTFQVDTTDFKTVKQNQFIGCFHCFSPVTYSTQGSTC